MSVYEVAASAANQKPSLATVSAKASVDISGFKFETMTGTDTFSLKNSQLEATFSGVSGFLQAVTPNGHSKVDLNVQFVHYGARPKGKINNKGGDNLSGAYLFLPDAEAKELPADEQEFMVVSGPIMKKVYVVGPKNLKILQVYSLVEGAPSIEIVNEVDIRSSTSLMTAVCPRPNSKSSTMVVDKQLTVIREVLRLKFYQNQKLLLMNSTSLGSDEGDIAETTSSNFELAMRMNTNVQSGDDLYTDLNGMQIIRRRRQLDKLPIQAHFYPMPSAAYIEDTSTRLSLLTAQPLGVASLKAGQLEVMLDRRLDQDDGRGLEENVHDNLRTLSRFRLLVEPLKQLESKTTAEERVGFLSLVGLAESTELLYPTVRMVSSGRAAEVIPVDQLSQGGFTYAALRAQGDRTVHNGAAGRDDRQAVVVASSSSSSTSSV
ncbi:unnamed protein product [Heligmosomoides polygyrus]|uniref:Glyco_hydro_38C domain-containing protein n=1 Tax=Heligmosomoides polygyrus TaxID=6339 RepID=A0A3P8BQG6_HELPZ|nr:unnamed protein product [Heligmosomoides polygyrus]